MYVVRAELASEVGSDDVVAEVAEVASDSGSDDHVHEEVDGANDDPDYTDVDEEVDGANEDPDYTDGDDPVYAGGVYTSRALKRRRRAGRPAGEGPLPELPGSGWQPSHKVVRGNSGAFQSTGHKLSEADYAALAAEAVRQAAAEGLTLEMGPTHWKGVPRVGPPYKGVKLLRGKNFDRSPGSCKLYQARLSDRHMLGAFETAEQAALAVARPKARLH